MLCRAGGSISHGKYFLAWNRVFDGETPDHWKFTVGDFKNWTNLVGGRALGQMLTPVPESLF